MGEVSGAVDRKESISTLWEEVWRQPWAMQVRLVMGDALQESGDAHGELIAVQLALERLPDDDDAGGDTRGLRDALEVRQTQLLKQLRARLLGNHEGHVTWRAGFIDTATVHDVGRLSTLIECRAAWVIRSLRFIGSLDDFRDVIRRIDDGRAATLEEFRLGDRGEYFGCERVFKLQPLFDALPRLRHIELWCSRPDFTDVRALRLESLLIDPMGDGGAVLSSLGDANCPSLKSLTIALDDSASALPVPFLEAKGLGPIEHVKLDGPFEPEAVKQLLESRVASKVTRLTVHLPDWLRWSAHDLRWGAALDRLEQLDLIAPSLSAQAARQLERTHPRLKVRHSG